MAILTDMPSTYRVPGTGVKFDITSGARGLVALPRRVALVGVRATGSGTATSLVPYQIFVDGDGDTLFGAGSELALMCRAALKAGRLSGKMPEIWAVGIAAPAGVASTKTLTVTGPATGSGNIALRIAGRPISVPVASGDTATTMAAAIDAAIDLVAASGILPITASSAAAVATLTANQIGVNGEDLKVAVDSTPTGVAVAVASGVTGTGVYDITAALDVLRNQHYNAIVTANHAATDVSDLAAHITERSASGVKKWVFSFLATTGTLSAATTLATAANSEYQVVVAAEDFPNLPGEIAAHVAVTRIAEEDPSLTVSGRVLDLYPPPAASVFTEGVGGEQDAALAGGVTPLALDTEGKVKIVRLVTTKTTHNGAPFDNLRDFGVPYTLTWVGEQADTLVTVFMSDPRNKKMTANTRKRLRSRLLGMLRAAEALEYIQNVELHKDEVQVEPDATVKTRMNYDIPVSVVPGLEQAAGVLRLYVENAAA
jgi:phage tail sheath gpL-like